MVESILITQSLQNDMIKPIGRYDQLPNLLHIGFQEARRLMGVNSSEGPVSMVMRWAYRHPPEKLGIIHIRDWHDPEDTFQTPHFDQFGSHCVKDTEGAQFAFDVDNSDRLVTIINSASLNDFIDTDLKQMVEAAYKVNPNLKIGLIGVWTDAKVFFLAYELTTHFPDIEIATCSALTASSSRSHHFLALEQLKRLLGVKVFSSIGEFNEFLTDQDFEPLLPAPSHSDIPILNFQNKRKESQEINKEDRQLIRYLFRNCREVTLKELTGGFSGNVVLGCDSIDMYGHQEVPHVVKIGPQEEIGQERTSFERVEGVLGNNAPHITDFADYKDRGALKYRYASMDGNFANTFQKLYCEGLSFEECERFLSTVFETQLGRFYRAATKENVNLLEYYGVVPDVADIIKQFIEGVIDKPADDRKLTLENGVVIKNPYHFYKEALPEIFPRAARSHYFSFVHGDLNGANIIVDAARNTWLIDFFHTSQGHVLKDLIKLENDVLYIYTPLENDEDLKAAFELTDKLLEVEDLGKELEDLTEGELPYPEMRRAYQTISILRSFYPDLIKTDRNINQLLIGQIRYAGHTLIFDESNHRQKVWALYTLSKCCDLLNARLQQVGPLRVDWINEKHASPGRLGMTILPGRKDTSRSLSDDLASMKEQGVTHVLSLITIDELEFYGVDHLLEELVNEGFIGYFFPIIDQGICSIKEMNVLIQWIDQAISDGGSIMIHCVGGLGRSGFVTACYLISRGLSAEDAIEEVRSIRTERAIESQIQEDFVKSYEFHNRATQFFGK